MPAPSYFSRRTATQFRLLFSAFCLLFAAACSRTAPPAPPAVDGDHAMERVQELVAIGPRPSGSEGAAKAAAWIEKTCRDLGYAPATDTWIEMTPDGPKTFRNIEAVLPGAPGKGFILVASHYDTKKIAACPGFVGANDSGSSTGLLLELMRVLKPSPGAAPAGPAIRFAFFDGEECLREYGPHDGLHGSRRRAQQLADAGETDACRAMVLLDMVGDRNLNLTIPADTTPDLAERLFRLAEKRGLRSRVAFCTRYDSLLDDHRPFQELGIPSIDLIDFDYGPDMAWWHTAEDTLDKLSPASLRDTGTLTLDLLSDLAR